MVVILDSWSSLYTNIHLIRENSTHTELSNLAPSRSVVWDFEHSNIVRFVSSNAVEGVGVTLSLLTRYQILNIGEIYLIQLYMIGDVWLIQLYMIEEVYLIQLYKIEEMCLIQLYKREEVCLIQLYMIGDVYFMQLYMIGEMYLMQLYMIGEMYLIQLYMIGEVYLIQLYMIEELYLIQLNMIGEVYLIQLYMIGELHLTQFYMIGEVCLIRLYCCISYWFIIWTLQILKYDLASIIYYFGILNHTRRSSIDMAAIHPVISSDSLAAIHLRRSSVVWAYTWCI